jgi:signal transduction protein with GAF and PtsI domain
MSRIVDALQRAQSEVPRAADPGPLIPADTPLVEPDAPAPRDRLKSNLGELAQPRDTQEVSATNAVFNELLRPGMDPDKVFELVVQNAATLTGASGSAIALAEHGKFVCRARYGIIAPGLGTPLDPSSGLSGLCIRTGHVLRCDDAERDPRVDSAVATEIGIRSISVVPLIKDGKLVGIFEILSTGAHAFEKKEIETLQRMAKLVVLTMSRMGELRCKDSEGRAGARWWLVVGLMAVAFLVGVAASRLLGPLLLGR